MPWIIPQAPAPIEPANIPAGVTQAQGVAQPHFAAPFELASDGKPLVVQQDTPADIGACIYNILVCPQGAKLDDPSFGVPSPLFDTFPLDWGPTLAAVANLEPRAQAASLTQVLNSTTSGEVDAQLIVEALAQAEIP